MNKWEITEKLEGQLDDIDEMLEITNTFEKRASLHIAKTNVLLALHKANK